MIYHKFIIIHLISGRH